MDLKENKRERVVKRREIFYVIKIGRGKGKEYLIRKILKGSSKWENYGLLVI